MQAEVYYDKGVLVIDFTGKRLRKLCDILLFNKVDKEATVEFSRRNWLYIDDGDSDEAYIMTDVNAYDPDYVQRALPEYLEMVEKPVKKNLFGRTIKTEVVTKLKAGWVELQPSPPKMITTTQYRIIQSK